MGSPAAAGRRSSRRWAFVRRAARRWTISTSSIRRSRAERWGSPDVADRVSRVLLVGISARAIAESAAAAGYGVTTIDAFGDLDTAQYARCFATRRDFGVRYRADVVALLSRRIDTDAVAYAGGWENH